MLSHNPGPLVLLLDPKTDVTPGQSFLKHILGKEGVVWPHLDFRVKERNLNNTFLQNYSAANEFMACPVSPLTLV